VIILKNMAVCEFHDKYVDYLTGRLATEFVGKKYKDNCDWREVWCVVTNIAICRTLEQITPEEAISITSVVFKLYPQHEARIKQELAEKYHWI